MTDFYCFSDNSSYKRRFTWAYKIVNETERVDFVYHKCGGIHRYPVGGFDVVVEGGSLFPDVLGCGEYPFLIVSEAIVDDWHRVGIECFQSYPVGIAEVKSKKLFRSDIAALFQNRD